MGKFDDLKTKKKIDQFIDGAEDYQNSASSNGKEPSERLNVDIPKSLHKAIKVKAIDNDMKIRELVIKAINEYLIK